VLCCSRRRLMLRIGALRTTLRLSLVGIDALLSCVATYELSILMLGFDHRASSPSCICIYPSNFSISIDSIRLASSTSFREKHECITTTQPANHP
jgi:hypothetical protein